MRGWISPWPIDGCAVAPGHARLLRSAAGSADAFGLRAKAVGFVDQPKRLQVVGKNDEVPFLGYKKRVPAMRRSPEAVELDLAVGDEQPFHLPLIFIKVVGLDDAEAPVRINTSLPREAGILSWWAGLPDNAWPAVVPGPGPSATQRQEQIHLSIHPLRTRRCERGFCIGQRGFG